MVFVISFLLLNSAFTLLIRPIFVGGGCCLFILNRPVFAGCAGCLLVLNIVGLLLGGLVRIPLDLRVDLF